MILDYSEHINRNIFQNPTINENLIGNNDLKFILTGTSNEYDLQSVCNVNGLLGVITELAQVFLAICDTGIIPFSYTGSGNIGITGNQISLNFSMEVNNETVLNPRAYDGAVFEIISGTDNFVFRQNPIHGGTPIAQFLFINKECTFHGDCSIPVFTTSHISIHSQRHIQTDKHNTYLIPS